MRSVLDKHVHLLISLKININALSYDLAERYPDIEQYNEIIINNTITANLLIRNISMMYTKHAHGTLLKLIYLLTYEGRADFRL